MEHAEKEEERAEQAKTSEKGGGNAIHFKKVLGKQRPQKTAKAAGGKQEEQVGD